VRTQCRKRPKESTIGWRHDSNACTLDCDPSAAADGRDRPASTPSSRRVGVAKVDAHTGIVARAEPEREDGLGGDIRPQPRELDSDAELGLTVLAPGIALFALIAVVAQFAHPV
jgi:hypothetical protein